MAQYGNLKWHCTKCNKWNDGTVDMCPSCGIVPIQGAGAYRAQNILTPEEYNTHTGTLPAILTEVRALRIRLEELIKRL